MRFISLIPLCLLVTGITSGFQSCCKAECIDYDMSTLDFQNFNAIEMEKIKVRRFIRGNFTIALDSYYVSTNNIIIKDTSRVYLDEPLLNDFDFTIDVEKAGRVYTISDFNTRKENCNCGPGTHKYITGYKLNGVQYSVQNYIIEIKK